MFIGNLGFFDDFLRDTRTFNSLLGSLKTLRITKWATSSDGKQESQDEREDAGLHEGANVVSSKVNGTERIHAVLLDLDVPAYLVPSSTEGHSHLYIDVHCDEADYFDLLDALAKCGVIEEGYAGASKAKGMTCLRLPWVKKEALNGV